MCKIILESYNKMVGNKIRKMTIIKCPDCLKEREVRYDSVKSSETTCCRSCLNLRRPTKPKEELFHWQKYYRSKVGKIAHAFQTHKLRSKEKGWQPPTYTREELIHWAMSQDSYHILFRNWEESNYSSNLSPSIDRIDDYGIYSFDNIQLITWEQNNHKGRHYQKIGLNRKNSIAVNQYTLDGDFLNSFHSLIEAERQTGVSNASISRVCRNPTHTAGGFKWEYA